MERRFEINAVFQRFLSQYFHRHPILFNSLHERRMVFNNYYSLLLKQTRKFFINKLDPFNLCPRSIIFWFLIEPYNAIGINMLGLNKVFVIWRQQMEPNETIYLMFRILELNPPFPLTLLLMFSALGLVISDEAYRLLLTSQQGNGNMSTTCENPIKRLSCSEQQKEIETDNKQEYQTLDYRDPFILTPKMSIYYPVYDDRTSLGFLSIDFQHVELSVKQALEPSETIFSLIRFSDIYAPFPLQVAVMLLSIGLFITGEIYKFGQSLR